MTANIKILFAVESGSRAWGFHSPDSDYDVRFVYLRPVENYLSISESRDVYEAFKAVSKGTPYENDLLDIVGWDLRKALHLMRKSNPQLLEWLHSPTPYFADEAFHQHLTVLANKVLDLSPLHEHYKGMAKSNFREYLQGEQVRYKKYLYVLRPLLAAQYVREKGAIPPVDFGQLVAATISAHSADFALSLQRLLKFKMEKQETDTMDRDPILNEWIEQQLAIKWYGNEGDDIMRPKQHEVTEMLDSAFINALNTWGK
jgi:predicted nucleotidyltransferase